MRMDTYDANSRNKIVYPELSYKLTGILFDVHNSLGRYSREVQYCNEIEHQLEVKVLIIKER